MEPRETLVRAMAALVPPDQRARAIRDVSNVLMVDTFVLFLLDAKINKFLAGPGFPQTLPDEGEWRKFLTVCRDSNRHHDVLPWPEHRTFVPARGFRVGDTCIAVLLGGNAAEELTEEFVRLVPLLLGGLESEQARAHSEAQSMIAHQAAQESAALAKSLDAARRAAQKEIAARGRAEAEARAAREELARINTELEARVEERTASLKQTIADLDAFSYSISHDVRAPLRAMMVHATALLEDAGPKLEPLERENLQRIVRAAGRLDRLTADVLRYSRLARVEIVLKPVDLERLIAEVCEDYPTLQPDLVDIEVAKPLLPVLGDEVLTVQCLANLLTNAVKFVERTVRPRVRVWTEAQGEFVRVCIQDNGIGIAAEHEHRLFGLFDRIHPDHLYEGTGIGLAIVKRVVGRMDGDVGLQSQPNEGSLFWFTLRAAPVPVRAKADDLVRVR
jgi:signal transduction histidine kinase